MRSNQNSGFSDTLFQDPRIGDCVLEVNAGEREGDEEINLNDEESDDTVNGVYRGIVEPLD